MQLLCEPSFGNLQEALGHALRALKLVSMPALEEHLVQASEKPEDHALKEQLDQAFAEVLKQLRLAKGFVELGHSIKTELHNRSVQQGSTQRKKRWDEKEVGRSWSRYQ